LINAYVYITVLKSIIDVKNYLKASILLGLFCA